MSSNDSLQVKLSVIVITFNEADRLPACLRSLPAGCEVIVVDSGSTDETVAVARSLGALVKIRSFTDYADQKNFALSLATRRWVLSLDADEVLTGDLGVAILQICQEEAGKSAYQIPRRLCFAGKTMRFGKSSDSPLRLFRRGFARFVGTIHETVQVDSGLVTCIRRGFITHHSYRDLADYFAKFNKYTTEMAAKHQRSALVAPGAGALAIRFISEFGFRYVFRLGFLDGYPGFLYALISSFYAFTKYAKLRELQCS